jgi:hypothetical protein
MVRFEIPIENNRVKQNLVLAAKSDELDHDFFCQLQSGSEVCTFMQTLKCDRPSS